MSAKGVIRIKCPNLGCGRILSVPQRARGKLVRCRQCGTTISIPQSKQAKAAVAPAEGDKSVDAKSSETGD